MADPTPTTPPPAAPTPNPDVIEVHLDQEVAKLAKRDQAEARIDKAVTFPTLREVYRREVIQYYAGKDRGYQEGFVAGAAEVDKVVAEATKAADARAAAAEARLAARRPWWVWLATGVALPPAAWLAFTVVVKFGKIAAAVAKALAE